MKVNILPPAPPGFITLTPPVGGDAVIPFGNIVIPSLNNDLTNPVAGDIQVTQDAIYYVGVSVLLFSVGTAGVDPVKITLYKDNVAGQNIIWDYTQAGTEIEQRYHAADWIRLDDTSTLQARMVGPTIGAPITYALIDAYLDIGYGPLR